MRSFSTPPDRPTHSRGSDSSLPASDITTSVSEREVQCPHCLQSFETARRWQMSCPSCGYEWEEISKRTMGDRWADLRRSMAESLALGMLWTGVAFLAIVGL